MKRVFEKIRGGSIGDFFRIQWKQLRAGIQRAFEPFERIGLFGEISRMAGVRLRAENLPHCFSRGGLYKILLFLLFLAGFFLRTKYYLTSSAFEDDECRLILTMLDKNIWELFLPLGDAQSAPPLFLAASKCLAYLFGWKEHVLEFIPYIAGCLSLFYFYKLASTYFTKKISILMCMLIFVICRPLVTFSCIFKQYSLDVLIGILCLYYFPRIDWAKKQIPLCVLSVILPLVSLPSVFFLAALFIKEAVSRKKIYFLPILFFCACLAVYYFYNLAPSKAGLLYYFPGYWDDGYLKLSIKDFIRLMAVNFKYWFDPGSLTIIPFTLFLAGWVLCIFDRTKTRDTSNFMLIVSGLIFLAALLHLYILYCRVGLYGVSLFILFIIKPLDCLSSRKPLFWIVLTALAVFFSEYDINKLADSESYFTYSPKNLMQILAWNFNPETDVILTTDSSVSSYIFYAGTFNFTADKVYNMAFNPRKEEAAKEYFDNLPKDKKYWLYLIKDYTQSPVFPYIFKSIDDKEILYKHREKDSYLLYVKMS